MSSPKHGDAALLDEIAARANDDEPRLIYADWLEERGNAERAELIRIQIELAKVDASAAQFESLCRRETELLVQSISSRLSTLRKLGIVEAYMRRGFVEEIKIDARKLVSRTESVFNSTCEKYCNC